MKALIVETGTTRGALAAARALHRAGWSVGVGTPTGRGMASASRATARRHRVPPPFAGSDAFVDAINAAVQEGGYEVVFGAGDADLILLSAQRDEIRALVPYASHERVVRAVDKRSLTKRAKAVGLSSPATVEASDVALRGWRPPYVIKAAMHPAPTADLAGPIGVLVAHDVKQAAQRVAEIRAAGAIPLLQERIVGRLMAYAVVADRDSEVVASVGQVADGTWPPHAGVSARARTIAPDPALFDAVVRLLRELGWFGMAQLQFVLADDDTPRLIDFNGRFYGSLALAVAAGANLPAIWAALATDRPPAGADEPRTGVRYQWLEGDLRRALAARDGTLRTLAGSLAYSRGAVHPIWSVRDPWPSCQRLLQLPARVLAKLGR